MNSQVENSTNQSSSASTESPKRQQFSIPVSNGLFEHYSKMGDAVWLFLFLIDKTTVEKQTGDGQKIGSALRGRPIKDHEVAAIFKCSTETIRRWRGRLRDAGYIACTRTGIGYSYKVFKSKKFKKQAGPASPSETPTPAPTPAPIEPPIVASDPTKMWDHIDLCDPAERRVDPAERRVDWALRPIHIDNAVDLARTLQKEPAKPNSNSSFEDLKQKINDMYAAKYQGRRGGWAKDADEKLQALLGKHTAKDIAQCYRGYLDGVGLSESTVEWLNDKLYPFGRFVSLFDEISTSTRDNRRAKLEDDFLGDAWDESLGEPRTSNQVTVVLYGERYFLDADLLPKYRSLVEVVK